MINIEKFNQAVHELEPEFGPFNFLALFLRVDAPGVWDLVVSSPYLEEGKENGFRAFAEALIAIIGERDFLKISRIYTLDQDSEGLQTILRTVGEVDGVHEIRDETFYQVEVKRGYVFKANAELLQASAI